MIFHRRALDVAAAMALAGVSIFAISAAGPTPSPASNLDFLEVGKAYLIRFPEKSGLFSATTNGVSEITYTTADGEKVPGGPAIWSATLTIRAFRVVRLSKGSWVLLEHPEQVDDAAAWAQQLHRDLGAGTKHTNDNAKIRTVQTWVNLDHAIAISALTADAAKEP